MSKPTKPGSGVTNKRRRELAAAKFERQTARRADRAARKRRTGRIALTVTALVVVAAVAGVLFWRSTTPDDVADAGATPSASASTADIGCEPAPTPPAEPASWDKAPKLKLATGTGYTLTLSTNCGEIVVKTKPKKAPETVNSMLWLAEKGFFDDTLCHRLTTDNIYVLQCGDPTATGSGGPGFTVPDENLPTPEPAPSPEDPSASPSQSAVAVATYPAGTVAMANAGPGTSGSQFFIVYDDTTLPANYTVWGEVTDGLDVVQAVADAGTADGSGDGRPAAAIGILTTTVEPALG